MNRRIVIIGAGVVGAALADALVARGERDVLFYQRAGLYLPAELLLEPLQERIH